MKRIHFCVVLFDFQNLPGRNSPLWKQFYLVSTAGSSWKWYGSSLCVSTGPCLNFMEFQLFDLRVCSSKGVVLRAGIGYHHHNFGGGRTNNRDEAPEEQTFRSQGFMPWGWCLFVVSWLAKEVIYEGIFLSLSSDCYMFCVCVHSPDFTLISYTNLILIAFHLLTTLRTMLVLSVGVRLGQIKVVSHFRTTKIFQFFKVFIERSILWSTGRREFPGRVSTGRR